MKQIEVSAAVIIYENKIFCVQRPESKYDYISKKWEFPGGKIEEGETKQEALKRELQEELELDVEIGSFIMTVNHEYPDFALKMHAFIVFTEIAEIDLKEHLASKWLFVEDLPQLDWAAADIPIVERLMEKEV